MSKIDHNYIGRIGEEIACKYLKSKGFSVILRNYRKKWGEIDIIAQKTRKLFFVEVKTVSRENLDDYVTQETSDSFRPKTNSEFVRPNSSEDCFRPEDNFHPWKVKRLSRAIDSYLAENNISHETEWQLDLITVKLSLKDKKAKVERIENALI